MLNLFQHLFNSGDLEIPVRLAGRKSDSYRISVMMKRYLLVKGEVNIHCIFDTDIFDLMPFTVIFS